MSQIRDHADEKGWRKRTINSDKIVTDKAFSEGVFLQRLALTSLCSLSHHRPM